MKLLAHISDDKTRTQTIEEHLISTAALAGNFAAAFGAQAEAAYTALLHDIGKYSAGFQQRLQGGPPVDHSTAGAKAAIQDGNIPAALAIAGHHSGIPDLGNPHDTADESTLVGRSKRRIEDCSQWKQEISPAKAALPPWLLRQPDNLTMAFFTRMLYSSLVDADFIDTETFMDGKAAPRGMGEPLSALLEKVRAQAKRYLDSPAASPVAQERNKVLRACMEQGTHAPQGLYTLTVPTGGGKTFASLAFALEHAVAQKPQMERIIYVMTRMCHVRLQSRDLAPNLRRINHFSPLARGMVFLAAAAGSLPPLWDGEMTVTGPDLPLEDFYVGCGMAEGWRLLAELAPAGDDLWQGRFDGMAQGIAPAGKSGYCSLLSAVDAILQAACRIMEETVPGAELAGGRLLWPQGWRLSGIGFIRFADAGLLCGARMPWRIQLRRGWDDERLQRYDAQVVDADGRVLLTLHQMEFEKDVRPQEGAGA